MENLQSILNTLKGQQIHFALFDNAHGLRGHITKVEADFVVITVNGDELFYIPFNAIKYFGKEQRPRL